MVVIEKRHVHALPAHDTHIHPQANIVAISRCLIPTFFFFTAAWFDPTKIVSMDPWGHMIVEAFDEHLKNDVDVRPTIAITSAHIQMPELVEAMQKGRLKADGKFLMADGSAVVTKAAIEHVWYLP
jgi:hypothetical protein